MRVRILATLQECEATPTQLAQWLGASVGTVAYHVRTLASLGLIELVGETRVRGAVAHHYRAVAEAEQMVSRGDLAEAASAGAGATMLPLDPQICPVALGRFDDDRALATQASLRVDAAGWQQLSRACEQLLRQADQIARASAERLSQNPEESDRVAAVVLFLFEATDASRELMPAFVDGAADRETLSERSEAVS